MMMQQLRTMTPATARGRVVVVGEAPSRSSDPSRPLLSGASGARLRALAGEETWARTFRDAEFVNLFGSPSGWSTYHARESALDLVVRVCSERPPSPRLFLCGKRVAASFGVQASFLTWIKVPTFVSRRPGIEIYGVIFPHPSGKSRWWNEPSSKASAETFLRSM